RPGTQEPRSPPQLHPRRLHGLRHLNLETSDSAEHREVRNPVTCGPWGGRHSGSGVETSLVSNRWLAEAPTTYGACASTDASRSVVWGPGATLILRGRPSSFYTLTVKV